MVRLAIVCAILTLCGFLTFAWSTIPDAGAELGNPQAGEFASGRAQDKGGKPVAFDGKRAIGYLKEICALGPRMSGTPTFKKQVDLIQKHFEKFGAKVSGQEFSARQVSRKQPTDMVNLIVSWHPERKRRVILCTHYDTRPIADQEPQQKKWHDPFISANDGGSGVALLMELANHMKDLKTNVGVDFVLFDGEEYVFQQDDQYFFGSEHFAAEYAKQRNKKEATVYLGAILLDMIGGKNAKFPVEQKSWFDKNSKPVVKAVWAIAKEQKCTAFRDDELSKTEVYDDHVALQKVGMPAIDIIDFDYPHWHKLSDLPENCSGESLEQVAKVVSVWMQRVK